MNSKIQFVFFGIMVAILFSCLTHIEAGKITIDFDQPNGKPKPVYRAASRERALSFHAKTGNSVPGAGHLIHSGAAVEPR